MDKFPAMFDRFEETVAAGSDAELRREFPEYADLRQTFIAWYEEHQPYADTPKQERALRIEATKRNIPFRPPKKVPPPKPRRRKRVPRVRPSFITRAGRRVRVFRNRLGRFVRPPRKRRGAGDSYPSDNGGER